MGERYVIRSHAWFGLLLLLVVGLAGLAPAQVALGNPDDPLAPMKPQTVQRPESCLPCHQRQYDELRGSVKAGYRNVSPLFNGLETASNFLVRGLLGPVYSDSTTKTKTDGTPLTSNRQTTPVFTALNQVRAGFCLTCHNITVIQVGDKNVQYREVPELAGVGANFKPEIFRPL